VTLSWMYTNRHPKVKVKVLHVIKEVKVLHVIKEVKVLHVIKEVKVFTCP